MKIVDARTGKLQSIPFSLGEAGRGRWLEEVKVSNRPGQEPSGPEDVGYFVFGNDKKHCILTKGILEQRGILLRINTLGCYTRGTSGEVSLKGGTAKMLARGTYAFGDAGRIGGGTDELWHVESPAVFVVILCGGEHKGLGHRYLLVTRSFRTVMIKREALCQLIATDDDPEIVEVVRQFADQLHEDVRSALALAAQLEEAVNSPEATATITHFTQRRTIEEAVKTFGIAIPAAMGGKVGGVSSVQAGTVVPGTKVLIDFSTGGGGGGRYRFEVKSEAGLTRLKEERPYKRAMVQILAIVDSPDWHCAWTEYKDGEITARVLADAGGMHRLYVHNARPYTEPWQGLDPVTPPSEKFEEIFQISLGKTATSPAQIPVEEAKEQVVETPPVPAPVSALEALAHRFAKK